MELVKRIEQRVVLPGDTETERSRKMIAVGILSVSVVLTSFNALRIYNAGIPEIAITYGFLAVVDLIGLLLFLTVPRTYYPVAVIILLVSLFANLPSHLISGGYTSGLWILVWAILTPVLAPLFVGRRTVIFLTIVFVLTIVIAGLFEEQARANLPDLEVSFVALEASSNIITMGLIAAVTTLYLFSQIERYRQRADSLLLSILPGAIAERLKESRQIIADGYDDVTVLFADIVDFTTMSSGVDPAEVVGKLNEVFSDFDRLAVKHGLEKIKTIGDAYMVAGGLPQPREDHCQAVTAFALDMLQVMAQHKSWTDEPMRIRIGINRGPVVAGVIGEQKFIYDLWGDTVNVASRMESGGLSNEIQVTQGVKDCLDGRYSFVERGPIEVKGKGEIVTYLLRAAV